MVDTQGLVMKVVVHEAGLHDRKGAELLLGKLRGVFPRMAKVWADSAYRGLKEWMRIELGRDLEVVRHPWSVRVWLRNDQEPPPRPVGLWRCLGDGWWSVRLRGWFATVGCRRTMSSCQRQRRRLYMRRWSG